jgi:hypothetical protein
MDALTWGGFANADAVLAAEGKLRLHGRVAYLATTSRQGAPRVHPVTPVVGDTNLYLFMEPTSPKGHDLGRDPRFALHCGVEDANGGEGEFFVSGAARRAGDAAERARAVAAASYAPADRYVLFELLISRADARSYGEDGPVRRTWRAG